MKRNNIVFLLLPLLLTLANAQVRAQEDSVPSREIVKLKYFNDNNEIQYLILENQLKKGKELTALKGKVFDVYLDSNASSNLVATLTTNEKGQAKTFIPASLQGVWEASPQHNFLVFAKGEEETAVELEITKARIQIDTSSEEGAKSITVQVMKLDNSDWVPANEVEMKVGIQRLGGVLPGGEEETYTTDSTGMVTVLLNKDSLPGDAKGNIQLVALVEDNDAIGNLSVVKTVPWGVIVTPNTDFFNKRSLWATRFKTPYWLLVLAYGIIISVWATIIYLVFQIVRIKRLGTTSSS